MLLLAGCSSATPQPDGTISGNASGRSAAADSTSRPTTPASPSRPTSGTSGAAPSVPVDAADAVLGRSGTYSVLPPDGWGEATDAVGAVPGIDLVLMSSQQAAGFNTNLVIHVAPGDAALLTTELAKGREELADLGRTVSEAPDVTVGGVRATGFSTSFSQQGVEVVARSYGVHHDSHVYLLTLSSATAASTQAAADFAEILESWTWT